MKESRNKKKFRTKKSKRKKYLKNKATLGILNYKEYKKNEQH